MLGVDVAYRGADAPLADGDTLPVFNPPQGGIATELDVTIEGAGFDIVETLQIDVAAGSGQSLSATTYMGALLPFECVREGVVHVRNIPVAFDDAFELEALDGTEVELTVTVTREDGAQSQASAAVLLAATSY